MNQNALRNWGIGVGAVLLSGAVGLAALTGDPAPPVSSAPVVAGPLAPSPVRPTATPDANLTGSAPAPQAETQPDLVFESAGAEAAPPPEPPLSFIVRFEPPHALARAEALAAEGRDAEARQLAEQTLRRERALRGLCFDRFTLGGAEIVLRPCVPPPAGEREQFGRDWTRRLSGMRGVTYAESNAILNPEAGRRP